MTVLTGDHEITKHSLQDEIVQVLRQAIISGEVQPGQRLIEAELADTFGVSRAPLREALRELSADGLLEIIPRKGTFVVKLSDDDIREIYSLRLALESLAVEILVEKSTPDELAVLQEVIQEIERALQQSDKWRVVQLDMRFHELMCKLSGHSRLTKAWLRMSDQLRSFFAAVDHLYEDKQIIERHQLLVDAIGSGSKEDALAVIHDHIVNAADRLLKQATGGEEQNQEENQ